MDLKFYYWKLFLWFKATSDRTAQFVHLSSSIGFYSFTSDLSLLFCDFILPPLSADILSSLNSSIIFLSLFLHLVFDTHSKYFCTPLCHPNFVFMFLIHSNNHFVNLFFSILNNVQDVYKRQNIRKVYLTWVYSTSQTRKVLYQLIILISKFIKIKTYENC